LGLPPAPLENGRVQRSSGAGGVV